MKKVFYFLMLLLLFSVFLVFQLDHPEIDHVRIVVQSEHTLLLELLGYDGLAEELLFTGNLSPGVPQEIKTSYLGLARLVFSRDPDDQYPLMHPLIIGTSDLSLKITDPNRSPVLSQGGENEFFHRALAGEQPVENSNYPFATLLLEAQELLDSSNSIRTLEELALQKKKFQTFIGQQYQRLRFSYMVRDLLARYFMMHEYVSYAGNIQQEYHQGVFDGVGRWLEILRPFVPENKVLNYCVSLYYNRSMSTLGGLIIENFPQAAWCSEWRKRNFNFPMS